MANSISGSWSICIESTKEHTSPRSRSRADAGEQLVSTTCATAGDESTTQKSADYDYNFGYGLKTLDPDLLLIRCSSGEIKEDVLAFVGSWA